MGNYRQRIGVGKKIRLGKIIHLGAPLHCIHHGQSGDSPDVEDKLNPLLLENGTLLLLENGSPILLE